jgi:flagellin-specific chaperone FliS
LNQLKEVDIIIIEEVISISINLLKKGQFIMIIITFLKNLLVNLDFEVKNTTSQNIKDILYYISSNKIQFNLSNEEMIDINILLSYINSRVNKIGGISNLIDSFAGNS